MADVIYSGHAPSKEIFEVFTETIEQLIISDEKVVYLDADLMSSMRSKELWRRYPDNVFNVGIAEANMVGVACGMYLAGLKPFIHSFAPFVTRRVFDQLYVSGGYADKSICIIGSEPGICATDNGGTHMTFEDIALMRTIPGACVVDVSDAKVMRHYMEQAVNHKGLTYIRTPRRGLHDIYGDNELFEYGRGKLVKDGDDITIIASGIMTATAVEAAVMLEQSGISAAVIDPVTIKPLDRELIEDYARKTNKVLTVENHNIMGGLGSAVCEFLSDRCPVKITRMGINDRYGEVGDYDYLRRQFGLTVEDIVTKVKGMFY